ncbi:thiosulfate oxidation carrier protein SoxY [Magnetospirillum moscoviense]|uniref:Thiosulfate oxidation carrier protein SoxY n=1 Tax=Magnetospirillum moscoviense TaxID=1437059 RepID=A0A178MG12_9PROT|nr:thiosulfate oxidation carrier protein SoxY [Magnetospirillum moscoviense]MBF0324063.1 thiosulfate oxidation carrier protein SoxY [Alphaproteobacteria bacterium]OAN47035.1 thiosulfate oxidation carrier protein SoxY [Magnetospirillum moscoviense]
MRTVKTGVTRRSVLAGIGAGAAATLVAPKMALADKAATDEAIAKLAGGAKVQEGKVKIQLPQIAENGNTVPFTVSVDSPMTEASHVKAIHVMAEGNPSPQVASFTFTPTGKATVSMRLRLGKTQDVRAIALMSDGSVWEAKQEVKVTIGGCGG